MAREAKDPSDYVDQKATPLQERFAEWLTTEEVGADPSACKSKQEAFELGVKLGTSLRIVFQKSDFNQEARATDAQERASAKKAAKKAAKAAKATAAEVEEDADEDEEETPPPAKKAAAKKAAPAKKAAAKKATKRAAAAAEEEPF